MDKFVPTEFKNVKDSFNSLDSCLDFIKTRYPENQTLRIPITDIETGEVSEAMIPAFLYRGEKSSYLKTVSSMERLRTNDAISENLRTRIDEIVKRIEAELREFSHLSPMYSAAYLQHYGLPSELIDITSDLNIAAFFASCGNIGSSGLLCVLDVANIFQQSIIIDLKNHPSAERPRKQAAYAFFHHKFTDIKEAACVEQLGLDWFSFKLTESDKKKYKVKDEVLDASIDKVAGIIQLIIDNFEKMDDEIAKWLSENVVPAPFATRVIDYYVSHPNQPKTIELISTKEAGINYNYNDEKIKNYKKWSNLHPEIRAHKRAHNRRL